MVVLHVSSVSQSSGTSRGEDLISKLPDDILVSAISLLELEEAFRTSVLSHRWMKLWTHYSGSLDFSHITPLLSDLECKKESLDEARSRYVSWVNRVLEAHEGSMIDKFVVRFCFHKGYRHHIDKWLDFALARNVKSLVLDFGSRAFYLARDDHYSLLDDHISSCSLPLKLNASRYRSVTSFSISSINVTEEFLQSLLLSCPLLERLCVKLSYCLRNLRVACRTLKLKFLKVCFCFDLEKLEVVCAPNLCCFEYRGPKIELHIENVPSLTEVSVSWTACSMNVHSALDSLVSYLPQLAILRIQINLERVGDESWQLPVMGNLKHFHLTVITYDFFTVLDGAVALITRSPVLHKFTFELILISEPSSGRELYTEPYVEAPIQNLRELEFITFTGCAVDTAIALFCIKNAPMLEKLIIDRRINLDEDEEPEEYKEAGDRAILALKAKLPPSVEFLLI